MTGNPQDERSALRSVLARAVPLVLSTVALLLLSLAPPARAALVGDLSGTITAAGEPMASVQVIVTPVTGQGARGAMQKVVLTDSAGRYHLPDLYHRKVKIRARAPAFGPFVDTYWPAAYSFIQAGIVEISSWPVTADIELAAAGSLSGRVVAAQSGEPLVDARVSASLAAATAAGPVGLGQPTDERGAFTLGSLPPGELRLRVRLPVGSGYLVSPVEIRPSAPLRVPPGGQITGVQLRMQLGAEIRGTVRDDLGAPVQGATIKVIGCAFACPLLATSDEAGNYNIPGVRPGERLGVLAWRGEDLLKQWYPGRDNAALASDIELRAGDVLEGIDFTLTRAAFLDLEVRDVGNNGPVSAIVLLRTRAHQRTQYFPGHSHSWRTQRSASEETFRVPFGPLPPGRYDVRVTPGTANPGYLKDRWLASYGVAPDGTIRLSPGQQARAVVGLIPAPAPASQDSAAHGSPGAPWPGLQRGFLAPMG